MPGSLVWALSLGLSGCLSIEDHVEYVSLLPDNNGGYLGLTPGLVPVEYRQESSIEAQEADLQQRCRSDLTVLNITANC